MIWADLTIGHAVAGALQQRLLLITNIKLDLHIVIVVDLNVLVEHCSCRPGVILHLKLRAESCSLVFHCWLLYKKTMTVMGLEVFMSGCGQVVVDLPTEMSKLITLMVAIQAAALASFGGGPNFDPKYYVDIPLRFPVNETTLAFDTLPRLQFDTIAPSSCSPPSSLTAFFNEISALLESTGQPSCNARCWRNVQHGCTSGPVVSFV